MLDIILVAMGLGFFALSVAMRSPATGSEENHHDLRLLAPCPR